MHPMLMTMFADALKESIGGDGGWSSLLARYSEALG